MNGAGSAQGAANRRRPLLSRPSGNASAILTPPTPELLLCSGQKVRFDNRGWTKLLDTPAYQFYMEALMH
ncbi:hypothetical protein CDN93_07045 [Escherichia coli]|uniref:Uncharacterized protein n=2 Tax=Enterobacteriaceae TaxID=543 RepID=A0A1Y2ZLD3_ECOLX|nr:hypothetical protein EC767_15985 [Escherichia coli]ARE48143.1 hypothetical protein B6N50_14420 [Escherichia coli C]ASF01630.1 hypothetical protein CEQ26_04545 [Escherichia coli O104:H4]ATG61427.1 hypothetical protein AWA97_09420 [Escherichia coli O104:H21 str. CFSAN002236]AUG15802.1 hypothetical protein CXP41_05645 [Escherichia coli str. K-12 substr. MG1655]AYB98306.1 hypothetical protein CJZ69_14490 [Escherichia coli ATCC 8739]EFO2086684.1 hypothetical protein [Escherichia coli O109]EFO2